jgi:2,4-dienoyl-CoA reductase-like NADH-dependent reductase (Old Yellow Enzyme family)/pyruvate/2-oxoglutarate dehydrogenase complex dihydrolipoamide dehydrogenase (E3) component
MYTSWKILEPVSIRQTTCPNRIIMAAHSYGYADDNGLPTQSLIDYMVERVRGGAAMVIMGATAVSPEGAITLGHITRNLDDQIIPWYEKLATEVHSHGGLVLDQLMHVGGQLRAREGVKIVAPSAIPHERSRGLPVELSTEQIQKIVSDFINAAVRANKGGLDGVEIKCDQGLLIHQFLSPHFNRRLDRYGGTSAKRMTFLLEILEGIRKNVDERFIVGVRVVGDTLTEGDIALEDTIELVERITGQVDYFHVNGATNSTFRGYWTNHGDSSIQQRNFARFSKELKKYTNIPVIAASMINHPYEAEDLIRDGAADLIAMTRAHIADPEIVNKVKQDRVDEIRPCVLSNQGCVGNHYTGAKVRCIHNPSTGRERELGIGTIHIAEKKKAIGIIGGGISGMEFSRVAALRGHEVHLFEKGKDLGGQLLLASKFPYRQGLLDVAHYLEKQITKLGVHIYRETVVDKAQLINISSELDDVVIATGSKLFIPENYGTLDQNSGITIQDLLTSPDDLGNNFIVVDNDWRQNSLAVAEWLVQKGKKVTIISSAYYVGDGIDIVSLTSSYSRLQGVVKFKPLTEFVSMRNKAAKVRNVITNKVTTMRNIDKVVFVTGSRPENSLYLEMKDELKNLYHIGDSAHPMGIPEAILEANKLARII